eukprot:CAMPEP_0206583440 /NCGR_PEP_ID=MMETSP0325_2-20121206/35105_1 /ASSEMBLY_ACC=CAM_ASM_000347 /TAXON_ID=2866 /ORGANISM="Crypthecodinium cohnii, Strain Seligo" /LENGTH=184 /DNA_ID=CAMNT_0054090361 /DNA_START=54 /DNA_END=605 /DNA_ORIENTATION=+
MREFMRGLHGRGFKGDIVKLYTNLDFDGSGRLSAHELAYLDEWTLVDLLDELGLAANISEVEEEYSRRVSKIASDREQISALQEQNRRCRKNLPYPRIPRPPIFLPAPLMTPRFAAHCLLNGNGNGKGCGGGESGENNGNNNSNNQKHWEQRLLELEQQYSGTEGLPSVQNSSSQQQQQQQQQQ